MRSRVGRAALVGLIARGWCSRGGAAPTRTDRSRTVRLARRDDRVERVVVPRRRRDETLRDTMENGIVLEARNTFRDQMKMSAQAF